MRRDIAVSEHLRLRLMGNLERRAASRRFRDGRRKPFDERVRKAWRYLDKFLSTGVLGATARWAAAHRARVPA